jgi:tripeptide aminopeptidase
MRRLGLLVGLLWCLAYADSYQPLLNHERMTQLFIEMAKIESGSENEAAICEFVAKQLRELGAETVIIDEASKQIGGTGGNVFARFKGTVNAPPLLLNAHVDTVYSTEGIQLIRDETEIRTDGKTILGADNKAGVAIILEVLRTLKERNLPHPPLEVVFTIREEKGLLGAKAFDTRLLRACTGLVVDGREDPSALFVQSPTHWKWEVVFIGKAAHAGAARNRSGTAAAQLPQTAGASRRHNG